MSEHDFPPPRSRMAARELHRRGNMSSLEAFYRKHGLAPPAELRALSARDVAQRMPFCTLLRPVRRDVYKCF